MGGQTQEFWQWVAILSFVVLVVVMLLPTRPD